MRFAVIGHPVAHSLSPAMHTANFRALGIEAQYVKVDVAPEDLPAAIDRFRSEDYRGINVTVPHKVAVAKLMDRLDASAELVGAVNTVLFADDGSTCGHNTDMAGFLSPLTACGFVLRGARVLLLGAGGAARAVAHACLREGCARLEVFNRTRERAAELREELLARWPGAQIGIDGSRDCDLVVNATTVGLRPEDGPAIEVAGLPAHALVYDLVPVSRDTATVKVAKAAGHPVLNGLGMLVAQAAESFRIWTGLKADAASMLSACGPTNP